MQLLQVELRVSLATGGTAHFGYVKPRLIQALWLFVVLRVKVVCMSFLSDLVVVSLLFPVGFVQDLRIGLAATGARASDVALRILLRSRFCLQNRTRMKLCYCSCLYDLCGGEESCLELGHPCQQEGPLLHAEGVRLPEKGALA